MGSRTAGDALPDDVLTDRARDGDTRAFEVLLRRHQAHMFTLALGITGNAADAEDAVQSGFVSAWRALPRFRSDAGFASWLYRIVSNAALSLVRARRVVVPLPDRDDRHPATPTYRGPAEHAERAALAGALVGALATLPDEQREVWVLREVDRHSYAEVAGIVGESASTVRGRLARARAGVAEAMGEWK